MTSIFTPDFSQKLGNILETLDEESKKCVIKAIGILNGINEKEAEINMERLLKMGILIEIDATVAPSTVHTTLDYKL